ncbi:hypothetical protein D030_2992B, partial [Vibrio parahaemolyticus AQ3810]
GPCGRENRYAYVIP